MTDEVKRVAPETVGLSSGGLDAVEAVIGEQIDAGVIAGAVTLTARHGRVARMSSLGVRDIGSATPMTEDTIFRIFSMTKPITGTAMMILRDEGLWHPDDPIARHLPELADLQVLVEDGSLVRPDHAPTMAELMTHRAGFGYGLSIGEPADRIEALYREAGLWQAADLNAMIARLATLPLAYQPGTRWRYSLSMDVQGAIIERLSGLSLPDFLHTRLFEPLGMTDTGFFVSPDRRHRLATLYYKADDDPLVEMANPIHADPAVTPSLPMGGAGLFSTATDYARYAQLLLNDGEWNGRSIVSAAALREQMTNHLPDAMLATRFVAGQQKFRPGFGYGYNGVVVTDPVLAGLPVGRGSYHWDGAAGTWFWVDPENDLLFVGMIQLLSYAAPPLQEQTQTLMARAILAP